MTETQAEAAPRKRLIIKLHLPRSERRDPPPSEAPADSRGHKGRQNQCDTDEHSKAGKTDAKRPSPRTVSYEDSKQLKHDGNANSQSAKTEVSATSATGRKTRCNSELYPIARPSVHENTRAHDSRIERKNKESIPEVKRMDRIEKMQCWVILKRLMVGRDGWAFKQPLEVKGLEDILGNSECKSWPRDLKDVKAIGFEEIESKLKKLVYAGPDEFADDMRLVFSHALLYPPRNEIHRIGRRLSESFELSWKTLKDKWSKEEGKGNKVLKKGHRVFPEVDDRRATREVHEKKIQKGKRASSCDADDNSLPRQKRGRTSKDSCTNFQYKARSSRYCTL